MKLRSAPRYKRRVPLRFWEPDSGSPHQGFTVDISLSGLFIATRSPLATGERFRLELLEPQHNYIFQGEVVRSAKVAPELQKVAVSGMGVRLLNVDELVGELIPKAAGKARVVSTPAGGGNGGQAARPQRATKLPPPAAAPGSATRERPKEPPTEKPTPVYLLRFASPEVFLQIFLHHREEGGFFVPTRRPAPEGAVIRVTFELLRSGVEPLELDGRVESHLREAGGDGPATGMRVSFLDPEAAMEQLRTIIRRLRGAG